MKQIYIGIAFIIIITISIMMFIGGYNDARVLLDKFGNNITLAEYYFINEVIDNIKNPIERDGFSLCVWRNPSYADIQLEESTRLARELVAQNENGKS